MKKYMMLGNGDCWSACVASLLNLPEYTKETAPVDLACAALDAHKNGDADSEVYKLLNKARADWLDSLGYSCVGVWMGEKHHISFASDRFVGIACVSNEKMRDLGVQHSVIAEFGFRRDDETVHITAEQVLHDPAGDGHKYDDCEFVDVLFPKIHA